MLALLMSCLPSKLDLDTRQNILYFMGPMLLDIEDLRFRRRLRDDKSFTFHMLHHVLCKCYVEDEELCVIGRWAIRAAKIHHPLVYTAFDETCSRLALNQWLHTKGGYEWDTMEQYCIRHFPNLAGVLGPEEGDQIHVDEMEDVLEITYTEKQVSNCWQNVLDRVMSRVRL